MEPDPERERDTSVPKAGGASEWSSYDAVAAAEEVTWRRDRRRRWLLSGGIFGLVLCLAASLAGYFWFARATKIDRSTPVVVVLQYVDAVLTDRDLSRAKLYECGGADPRGQLLEQLRLVEDRERQFNVVFIIDVTNFEAEEIGKTARVRADIEFVAPMDNGGLSQLRQPWLFELKDEDGWRICRASKQEQ